MQVTVRDYKTRISRYIMAPALRNKKTRMCISIDQGQGLSRTTQK